MTSWEISSHHVSLQVKGRSDPTGSTTLREQMYWWVMHIYTHSVCVCVCVHVDTYQFKVASLMCIQIFVVDSADMMRLDETGEVYIY